MKVMTYNIHSGRGARRSPRRWANPRKLAEIAAVIASYDPDLVVLQEVDVPGDQARELAARLAMNVRAITSITGGDRRDYGIATLSKLPIDDSRELALPQRSALFTRHGELGVINTHLSMRFRDRPAQVAALVAAVGSGPFVIAGDFNMAPLSRAYRTLARGFTGATRFARTWPAPAPIWPVDHILVRGFGVAEAGAWTGGGAREASDHLPLVARIVRAW